MLGIRQKRDIKQALKALPQSKKLIISEVTDNVA
jgi:hypothetical protein